jgi:hypothetical protein
MMQANRKLLTDALLAKFAVMTKEPTMELLAVRILRNENGTLMEPEAFKEQVEKIKNDGALPFGDRVDLLNTLRDSGKPLEIRYRNYADVFANAMGLKIEPQDGTMAEKQRAEEALAEARLEAAVYVLSVQHPDIVEQMEKQREMYDCLNVAVAQVRQWMDAEKGKLNFVKLFMHMLLFDLFLWNRQSVDFTDVRGQQSKLLGTNLLTGEEGDLYAYCKPLVLMNILSAEDPRIDKNHQSYLSAKAKKLMDEIDRMPAEQYEAAQKAAQEFIGKYANTPSEILFDRGDLSKMAREQNATLVSAMLKEAKIFIT